MPKKARKLPTKPQNKTISLSLDSSLVDHIDELVKLDKDNGEKTSRSSIARSLLLKSLVNRIPVEKVNHLERFEIYKEILSQIKPLVDKAKEYEKHGETKNAQSAYLLAASKELEALATLSTPDERAIANHLVEIVFLIKKGTGYSRLPETPDTRFLKELT